MALRLIHLSPTETDAALLRVRLPEGRSAPVRVTGAVRRERLRAHRTTYVGDELYEPGDPDPVLEVSRDGVNWAPGGAPLVVLIYGG